jgi:hypothetical protein
LVGPFYLVDITNVHYGDLTLYIEIGLLGTESFIHVPTASSSNPGVVFRTDTRISVLAGASSLQILALS